MTPNTLDLASSIAAEIEQDRREAAPPTEPRAVVGCGRLSGDCCGVCFTEPEQVTR